MQTMFHVPHVHAEEYNDRVKREMAWIEIAEIMYDDWTELRPSDKCEKVKDLQKKWKGLRDYFTRVKNKKYPVKEAQTELQRHRKRPFLDMLYFLNTKKKPIESQGQSQQPIESQRQLRTATIKRSNPIVTTNEIPGSVFKTLPPTTRPTPIPPKTQETTDRQFNDPDWNFLLSILPDMKSMNPGQNFEFRFQVMTLLKDMKYNQPNSDYYVYCPQGPSTPFKAATETEVEIDPISNDSVLSSPEDIKITLQDSPNNSPK